MKFMDEDIIIIDDDYADADNAQVLGDDDHAGDAEEQRGWGKRRRQK